MVHPHPRHNPDEFSVPEDIRPRCRFVGQIVRPSVIKPRPPSVSPSLRITVCGGAGGYPGTVEFYNLALTAIAECRSALSEFKATLIVGPLFRDWKKLSLREGIRVLPFEPDMATTLAASDLVLCQAGYNTIAEISAIGTPAICVPGDRGLDDQYERARTLAQSVPTFSVFESGTAQQLAKLIVASLRKHRKERPSPTHVSSPGASLAAQIILDLVMTRTSRMMD